MPDCEEAVYSEDYYDFIVERSLEELVGSGFCMQEVDFNYVTVYYRPTGADPELNLKDYTYTAIPNCFGLLDQSALESSGIIKVRDQPNLSLTGRGVLIGFVDTDFDYTNPLFCHSDGTTRIERIWNQEDRSGMPPEGFIYGTEYTREQINEELISSRKEQRIPYQNGHGTHLAALAAGSVDYQNQFSGAAPECDIVGSNAVPPAVEGKDGFMLFLWDCPVKFFIGFPMPGVNAVITDLLKMFFRDMLYRAADKVQDRDGFCYKFFVLMAAVMEGHVFTVPTVNAGCGNDRPAKAAADIFVSFVWAAFVWPGIDIKAVFMVFCSRRILLF